MMKSVLDEKDIVLLRATQDGIPLVAEPFRDIAKTSGLSEEEVISRLKRLKDEGVIRRFGASINNRKAGIVANAMVVWKVPQSRVEEVGEAFAKNERVTHCYVRKTVPDRWMHNLFTVLHGYDHATVEMMVKEMSNSIGIEDYRILFSTREFKKTSNGRIVGQAISGLTKEVNNA